MTQMDTLHHLKIGSGVCFLEQGELWQQIEDWPISGVVQLVASWGFESPAKVEILCSEKRCIIGFVDPNQKSPPITLPKGGSTFLIISPLIKPAFHSIPTSASILIHHVRTTKQEL